MFEDFEDQQEEVQKAIDEATLKRAKAYHDVFGSESGQKILAEWMSRFFTGSVPGGNATEREVAMRDGKQELVNEIFNQLRIVTTPRGE